jgi:predicted RNA-binding Zn ribbon-like protein
MRTGQWLVPNDGFRWWYDSGALSLDFAHTGVRDGPPGWEQFHAPADLTAWLGERFDRLDETATERELSDALGLRASIYSLARAAADGDAPAADDIDIVNLFAATPDIPPALAGGHRQAGTTALRTGQVLSTIARDAVDLFGHEAGRIRECSADNCKLVFYDESRTNNRRWCSMQRCGNRAKVRAFRAKEKA